MRVYVIGRSKEFKDSFLLRHKYLGNVFNFIDPSVPLRDMLYSIIQTENEPTLVVTDNVYLNIDYLRRTSELISYFADNKYSWGCAGNLGLSCHEVGLGTNRVVSFVSDSDSVTAPNCSGIVVPAQYISGNVLLLNVPALKNIYGDFPNIDNLNNLNFFVSLEVIRNGLGAFIAPQLMCYVDGLNKFLENFSTSDLSYLSKTLKNRFIETVGGDIFLSTAPSVGRIDFSLQALKCAKRICSSPLVTIVVRTQFNRKELLFRCLASIKAFICATGSEDLFDCLVVTDKSEVESKTHFGFKVASFECDLSDSRLFLVQKALEKNKAPYIWFIDDDDWLFPNEAQFLADTIQSYPLGTTFYIGSKHFAEKMLVCEGTWSGNSRCKSSRYFSPKNHLFSLTGSNYIPFCGIIFPAKSLCFLTERAVKSVTYCEDYFLELSNIFSQKYFPVVIDKLFIGISIREVGNTVTETDRTKWKMSTQSAYYYALERGGIAMSFPINQQTSINDYGTKLIFRTFIVRVLKKIKLLSFAKRIKGILRIKI